MGLFLFLGDRLALPGVGLNHYSPRPAGFKRIARRTLHAFLDRRMRRDAIGESDVFRPPAIAYTQ
ncbi:hypothetical protein DF107_23485 [Burkholderia stagnalis]|nr:hypothetical protein WS59_29020 [Burkholderia stagnalis]KVD85731.1 hypothetical protein WS63_22280 [Burkholderia stagnalis]KVN12946.1 hypothetical protein WT10_27185 [Burkholderia stagnalis]KWI69504.1 hypothetical protein WT75_19130 [Burkholderia stagnalis]KWK44586.1 hypothetical protein WT80_22435 [Burkholderia stagnalis]